MPAVNFAISKAREPFSGIGVKEYRTGIVSTREMVPLDFFQGSMLLAKEEKDYLKRTGYFKVFLWGCLYDLIWLAYGLIELLQTA